jgi:hypothetical protein
MDDFTTRRRRRAGSAVLGDEKWPPRATAAFILIYCGTFWVTAIQLMSRPPF